MGADGVGHRHGHALRLNATQPSRCFSPNTPTPTPSWPMKLSRRLRYLFRRRDSEAEIAAEMQFHLEQRAAEYAERGLPADEAQYAAHRKFGNVGSLRE